MRSLLKLYNTKSGKKEPFKPIKVGKVGMYVCGPTVYDYSHIGHARAYVFFDIVFRHLQKLNYDVKYVRNITDIDDKIIKRAQQANKSHQEIATFFAQAFIEDMNQLGCLTPTVQPKATEHIDEMITMIGHLIAKGNAYSVNGDVYFNIDSYLEYLELSHRNRDELLVGARVEVNERKKNPLDFALWKASNPNDPSWQSPWGQGRPGWHIECSAMSQKHLGTTIDIHGGGRDLIFPHHENERAQSEAAHGEPFVNYWLHNGFVNIDKEKMSKSLGNFITLRDLLSEFHPEVIRHTLIASHYRSPMDFSKDLLSDSHAGLTRLYLFLNNCPEVEPTKMATIKSKTWLQQHLEAMNDDFNTPQALAVIFDALKFGNLKLNSDKPQDAVAIKHAILEMGQQLGILNENPDKFLKFQSGADTVNAAQIETLIVERNLARTKKNYRRADEIRDQLLAMNVILEDSPSGSTSWRIK